MKYRITQVKPKIFLVGFLDDDASRYDMCMLFVRYQEFYEGSSSKFRGKAFKLLDFMRWYSLKYGKGIFTYPSDWAGFNIPSSVIKNLHLWTISDHNEYDDIMCSIYEHCRQQVGDDFYLIGSYFEKDGITVKHEIAHGFFYTLPEYQKEMTKLVKSLSADLRKFLQKTLKDMGYTPKVYIDEIQAYMATGLPFDSDESSVMIEKLNKSRKPFISLYETYYESK